MKIRFAISAAGLGGAGLDHYTAEVVALEKLGFDTVWLSDIPLGATLDPIVGLAYAAAATTKLKLGANIVPVGRNPLTLAKSLAHIDQLSGGRLLLSFVVGLDQPGERQALGSTANRGALLEEVTPLLRTWWAGDPVTHAGGAALPVRGDAVTRSVVPAAPRGVVWRQRAGGARPHRTGGGRLAGLGAHPGRGPHRPGTHRGGRRRRGPHHRP